MRPGSVRAAVVDCKRHMAGCGLTPNDRHERAMDRLLGRDTARIALALGLARTTVQAWRDRHDLGPNGEPLHCGPGRRLAKAMRAALACGRSESDALAPLAALADEFGRDLAPRATGAPTSLLDGCARTLAETSEFVHTTINSLEGGLTVAECDAIIREGREAVEWIHRLIAEAQACAGSGR